MGSVTPAKEVLTDRFGRFHDYLRVSLTDRCNFRCVYCMPEEGVEWQPREELLTFEEIDRLARFFVDRGVRKIRLTGGEPSVRKGYLELVDRLAQIDGLRELALTTNGTRLAIDADRLKQAGLTTVNVSIDTLDADRFLKITRRAGLAQVLEGIERSIQAGLETKVNVVILPGENDDELEDFVELSMSLKVTVRFIEFMPFLDNGWETSKVITSGELRERLSGRHTLEPVSGHPSDVANEYLVDEGKGRIAFVSSVSESFCSGCSRLRITADGQLKSCLFLPPNVSLRDLIRGNASDQDLEKAVQRCLQGKWKAHPPMKNWTQRDHLTMVQIGG